MKKILVPTDFSSCANNAIDFAVQTAKYIPAEVTLFHSFEINGNMYTDYMGVNKEFNQSLLDEIHLKLQEVKKSIEESEGVKVSTYVAVTPLVNAILEVSEEKEIDLIVMGTFGASGLKEKLWGSKTAALIGKTKVPVMAIPYEYEWKKPEKFLFATNHFENNPTILDLLFEMSDLYMAQLQVAVMSDEEHDKPEVLIEHGRNITRYEKLLKEDFLEDTLTVSRLNGTHFEEALQDYINKNAIDILVMITYHRERSFWDRIFHPSKSKRMSYHSNIPVLVIPGNK